MMKDDTHGSYQRQIEKIKKQFKDFQKLIIEELRRQEQILNSMVDKIVEQMREGLEEMKREAQTH